MESKAFVEILLFCLALLGIGLFISPLIIWKNTVETKRVMELLLEEQEKTNAMLGEVLREKHEAATIEAPGEQEHSADQHNGTDADTFELH